MSKGTLVATLILFVLVIITCFFILLILPNLLWAWQTAAGYVHAKGPVTVQVVIRPEHVPLTADHALFSLLSSTDNTTGKSFQELLAYAVYYGNTKFTIDGVDVNVERIIDSRMRFLVPDKDYYLEVAKEYRETPSDIRIGNQNFRFNFTEEIELCGATSTLTLFTPPAKYMSRTTLTRPDLDKTNVILYLG